MNRTVSHFIVFILVFFSTLYAHDVKTLILPFILSFCIFYLILKDSLLESTFYTFLISLPFEKAIRQWLIFSENIDRTGYSLYFNLSLKIVFGLLLLLLFTFPKNRFLLKKIPQSNGPRLLLLFYIIVSVTSVFFQSRVSSVILGFIQLTISMLYFYAASIFFTHSKNNFGIFKAFIIAISIYSCTLGILQLQRQSPLGKFIELTPLFAKNTGYTTTDGQSQYRVAGFISHPVYFGSFLSILIPILVGIYFEKKQLRYLPLIFFSVVTILATQSRSTWINLAIITTAFILYYRAHPFQLSNLSKKIVIVPLIILTVIYVLPSLFVRIKSIPDLITNHSGSAFSRLNLNLYSLEVASHYPLTGVGLYGFTTDFHQAPPHSTILIILVELGIPAAILFFLFIIKTLRITQSPIKFSPITFGVWIGLITFVISSQFHPLFNLDPTFDLFMLSCGTFISACPKPFQT